MSKRNETITVVPTVLLCIAAIVYVIGTLSSWNSYTHDNIYSIIGAVQKLSQGTNVSGLGATTSVFVYGTTVLVICTALLQLASYLTRKNGLRILSGVLGIIASIIPFTTFLGTYLLAVLSGYGDMPGVIITTIGAILLFIFSIVALVCNKSMKR